ncbi:MAG TPA: phenylacetate--CoA ligase family protein [Kiritimatiellae bacterium]|nr:phenylacetate--CoA ligase family protein [Kiritimatiellia bacterium]
MTPWISRFLAARLLDRQAGHRQRVAERFQRLRHYDYLGCESREVIRRVRLAALLACAAEHVPHFRTLLKGVSIRADNALEVLADLPPMTREQIQSDRARFVSDAAQEVREDYTGGSTGTPMKFLVDPAAQRAREASIMWADSLAGWRPGHRIAMLWGSDRDVCSATANLRLRLRWLIENRRWFDAFEMSERRLESYHRALTRFRPHLIVAYASAIDELAAYLEQKDLRPPYPSLAIVSSAEVLTQGMRRRVEAVFACPVYDRYGNREAGAIAAECSEHRGLHVNEFDFIVEVDSPDPFRRPGPLRLTYLANYAMPLIRYDSGDLALLAEGRCPCGRGTRRLQRIVGRISDVIVTRNGNRIHGEYVTHQLYGVEGVRRFQFIQESLDEYRLLLQPEGKGPPVEVTEEIRRRLETSLGPGVRVMIEIRPQLEKLPSGKFRFTASRLREGRHGDAETTGGPR